MSSPRRQHGVALPLGARAPDPKTVGGTEVSPPLCPPPGTLLPAARAGSLPCTRTATRCAQHLPARLRAQRRALLLEAPYPSLGTSPPPPPRAGGHLGSPRGVPVALGALLASVPGAPHPPRPVPSLSPPLSEQRSRW